MSTSELIVEGARQNNLNNISLRLPHNIFIAVTGVSGSGKSSLAFDTIFAEGQWRFIESLSTYARLFLEKLDRPDVDAIRNIRPAIALEQRNPVKTSRSTTGTATELYDYLRLLYAKAGSPHCPQCDRPLRSWSPSSAAHELVENYSGQKAMIIFETDRTPEELQKEGFNRVRSQSDGEQSARSEVILDRLVIRDEPRLADSIELAWEQGKGQVKIEIVGKDQSSHILWFQSGIFCRDCSVSLPAPQPLLFSFNHPLGACPQCKGFGNNLEYSLDCIVPDQDRSLEHGAIEPWSKPAYRWWYRQFAKAVKKRGLIDLKAPFRQLPDEAKKLIFSGSDDFYGLDEFFKALAGKRYKLHVRVFLSKYRKAETCRQCHGTRLRSEALTFRIGGYTIADISRLPMSGLRDFFNNLKLPAYEQEMSHEILRQISLKLEFLLRVGIGYLTLNRETRTLSGGETQRINLSNQLSSKLTGTLYVLDEPTVGLHPRDVSCIAKILKDLSDAGNTVIAVEHDGTIIRESDWVVELGPGGGEQGGRLEYAGTTPDFLKQDTLTSRYLKHSGMIAVSAGRKKGSGRSLVLRGASGNNLKHIDISIPLHTLTCITGVSGSGKSTIVEDTLYRALASHFKVEFESPLPFDSIEGVDHLRGVKIIDQKPIGKTPRSNPVTYIKAFDPVRKVFAGQEQSVMLGYTAGHFSFNTEGGRCRACEGAGYQRLEMYFFEDLYVKCEECDGRRYRPEILEITYNGKNISEVLHMTVNESILFFRRVPSLVRRLRLMESVGLGYLRLGQPATTLSGGEAQRLKICAELGLSKRNDFLYILDEPTVGLHPDDIRKLLDVLNELVDAGNTVLVVEHNPDVIKCADWVIDIGPEGGDAGGYIVAEGTPEAIIRQTGSHTGQFLKEYLRG